MADDRITTHIGYRKMHGCRKDAPRPANLYKPLHYRYAAGIETCADLFDTGSVELAACNERVRERNPGCADDVARSARRTDG